MIHYQLRCGGDHEFDGWFRDSAAFDEQARQGLVACPICADARVSRAMMAPAVGKRSVARLPRPSQAAEPEPKPVVPAPSEGPAAGSPPGPMPDHMRAMLQKMRADVEKSCANVGDRFAEEARRIHRGDAEPRGIYGDATETEARELAEEGVSVTRIPWVPRADG